MGGSIGLTAAGATTAPIYFSKISYKGMVPGAVSQRSFNILIRPNNDLRHYVTYPYFYPYKFRLERESNHGRLLARPPYEAVRTAICILHSLQPAHSIHIARR
jgi:hypothetical protein